MFESSYGEGYLDGVDKGIEKGIKTGIKTGIEKGKLENIRETVKSMHKKGLYIEIIAEIAGIAPNDVKNILK